MTPKQQVRSDRLERLAHVDLVQLKAEAQALGLPARFLRSLDEMKEYSEQARRQLVPRESASL